MLSRRQVRIKVLQALYACQQSEKFEFHLGEKELLLSIDRFFDLFYYQTSLLPEITAVAYRQIEENKLKRVPTPEDVNPNMKFVDNRLIAALEKNPSLNTILQRRKTGWNNDSEIPRRIYRKFRSSAVFNAYMNDTTDSFEKDKAVILKLLKKFVYTHRPLIDWYEEKSIYWINDYDAVTFILMKIIQGLTSENAASYRFIDNTNTDLQEEIFFANNLYSKTIDKLSDYNELISQYTRNWEIERVALMDNLIMKMAVCEILEFPSVPVKVTLNEYIEIAKIYSTPKSSLFINGILDKIVEDFKKSGKIKKIGRGLIDN